MSVKVMSHVWELELPSEHQQVMLALADHAHDDGSECFPSIRYLAWKTGKSGRTVSRIMSQLRENGLIIPTAFLEGGRGHPTKYTINLSAGKPKPPYQKKDDKTAPFLKDVISGEERMMPVKIKDDAGEHGFNNEPSIEPSIEPSVVPRAAARAHKPVDDDFIAEMVLEYGPQVGSDDEVRYQVDRALNHKALLRAIDQRQYVRNWLRKEVKDRSSREDTPSGGGVNGSGSISSRGPNAPARAPSGLEKYR